MEFINRIWNAVKCIAGGVMSYTVIPFKHLVVGSTSRPVRVFAAIGAVFRVIFVVSFFVTVPALIMSVVTCWLMASLILHIVLAVTGMIALLCTPAAVGAKLAADVAAA